MAPEKAPLKVFIGSSSEGKEIAEVLQVALESQECLPTVWDQNVFKLGRSGLQSLMEATRQNSFAILVLTPDDTVEERGEIRSTPRDNVIFELGLFIGAFGPERTIAVQCISDKLKLPTDLLGITTALYNVPIDGNLKRAITPALTTIRPALRTHRPILAPVLSMQDSGTAPPPHFPSLIRDLTDLLTQVAFNRAGLIHQVTDEGDFKRWCKTLLNILRMQFRNRQDDTYTIWLRPDNGQRLRVYEEDNLNGSRAHYDFAIGEGLAGSVWKTGISAVHTVDDPHPDWLTRPNCENATYLCVSVEVPGGPGGVLSVGSDSGFSVERDQDIRTVELFARLLALAVE